MKTQKNIFTYILLLIVFILASCDNEDTADKATARLSVDKAEVTAAITGNSDAGTKLTISILANLGYKIESDEPWLTTDKTEGSGRDVVTLHIEENATGKNRVAHLIVTSRNQSETIVVNQTTYPESNDGLEIGHVYLSEDFNWLEQYDKDDQVNDPSAGSTLPLSNAQAASARARFIQSGYADANAKGSCFYLARHYLKMGKNNNQTGLAINLQQISPGKSTNIKLGFDVAPVVHGGLTTWDNTEVTVEISGPGTVGDFSSKVSKSMTMSSITSWGQWEHMEVNLYGVRATTTVTIRPTQYGVSGYYRWYLDNVTMEKTALN